MFTFEMSGFDEIERKLQQLADKTEAMDGEWDVFIASRTRFADWSTMQVKALADWYSRRIGLAEPRGDQV